MVIEINAETCLTGQYSYTLTYRQPKVDGQRVETRRALSAREHEVGWIVHVE